MGSLQRLGSVCVCVCVCVCVWGGRKAFKMEVWATSSGKPSVMDRKTDRAADISIYDGDHARVWK